VAGRAWLAAAGLCAGAAVGGEDALGLVLVGGGAAILFVRRRPAVLLGGLAVVALGAGMAASSASPQPLESISKQVSACDLEGHVLEQIGGLGTLVSASWLRCQGTTIEHGGEVVMALPAADAGAGIRAKGWLVPLTEDGYDRARRRAGADALFDASETEVGEVGGGVHRISASLRASVRRATGRLEPAAGALVRGLTIGDTSGLDPKDEEYLRRAGLAHLVAVSGSNVALVLGTVLMAARRMRPRVRVGLAGASLLLFVMTVGPEPSVLRAAVMGALALLVLPAGVRADPMAALAVAVIVVVGLRPGMVFSVGLHLSVAATAGIVLWSTRLARLLGRIPAWTSLALGVTLAAQIAVAPITAGVFGQVSLVGPVANLLALPVVAPGTVAGLLAALAELCGLPGSHLIAEVAGLSAGWVLSVGRHLGGLGWSVLEVPTWMGAVAATPVVISGALTASRRGLR
jgi:competence protein ComEC